MKCFGASMRGSRRSLLPGSHHDQRLLLWNPVTNAEHAVFDNYPILIYLFAAAVVDAIFTDAIDRKAVVAELVSQRPAVERIEGNFGQKFWYEFVKRIWQLALLAAVQLDGNRRVGGGAL